ncbi:MAG: hypothetical protein M3O36_14620 [Myxococcota bacterium]|nr:hypothetical protein [Myxococcota bacterium]
MGTRARGRAASARRLASLSHERVDGSGYHRGLTGGAIATSARVLAAADVAQALSQPRSGRRVPRLRAP